MSEPLLVDAIPGFRAWELDDDGRLWPAANRAEPWAAGINVARCALGRGHDAPAGGCTCGLYAFHTVHRQLAGAPVIGGIAAWGDVEVHRDGFRAGRARVLALAGNDRLPARERRALARAGERYGVPVVDRGILQPVLAARTRALPAELVGESPERWHGLLRGYDADQQLWVQPGASVTLGVSADLRTWMGGAAAVAVRTQDGALTVDLEGAHASVRLTTTLRGELLELNPRLDPVAHEAADVDGTGWVARIAPTHWHEDCAGFAWGATGRRDLLVLGRRGREDDFPHLCTGGGGDPDLVCSWEDVLRELRERPQGPGLAYESARALYDDAGIALGRALGADRAGREHLQRLGLVVALDTHDPAARLVFDLRPGRAPLSCGRGGPADVTVALAGDDLGPLLAGQLDLARETRSGRLQVTGARHDALAALSVLVGWSRRKRIGQTAREGRSVAC